MVTLAAQNFPATPGTASVPVAADDDERAACDLRLELAIETGATRQVGDVDKGLDAVLVAREMLLDRLLHRPTVRLGVTEK